MVRATTPAHEIVHLGSLCCARKLQKTRLHSGVALVSLAQLKDRLLLPDGRNIAYEFTKHELTILFLPDSYSLPTQAWRFVALAYNRQAGRQARVSTRRNGEAFTARLWSQVDQQLPAQIHRDYVRMLGTSYSSLTFFRILEGIAGCLSDPCVYWRQNLGTTKETLPLYTWHKPDICIIKRVIEKRAGVSQCLAAAPLDHVAVEKVRFVYTVKCTQCDPRTSTAKGYLRSFLDSFNNTQNVCVSLRGLLLQSAYSQYYIAGENGDCYHRHGGGGGGGGGVGNENDDENENIVPLRQKDGRDNNNEDGEDNQNGIVGAAEDSEVPKNPRTTPFVGPHDSNSLQISAFPHVRQQRNQSTSRANQSHIENLRTFF
ncbi:hypothetical protein RRG08_036762 [Elysia crispata]|uniref:Uncharacterized protein n=1 Tax=Elysia crispata TaxID=231223 RepID=A0AAE1CUU6_9GAST|nr:hypothetical protein RRG08_036762 [Elysia crispata]